MIFKKKSVAEAKFTNQIEIFRSKLLSYAMGFVNGNLEDAEELVQETLAKAFKKIDQFKYGDNFLPRLYTILRNNYINQYRKNKKLPTFVDTTENNFYLDSGEVYNTLVVASSAESSLSVEEIMAEIEKLPSDIKDPFWLYYTGYRYQEIADTLKIPIGTIKSRIHIARNKLQKKFKGMLLK